MTENNINKIDESISSNKLIKRSEEYDDFGAVMIYGNFKILDLDTKQTLINKRF